MFERDSIDRIDDFFYTENKGEIYEKVIWHVEKVLIEKALEHSHGNKVAASKILGINRNTLHSKIKKFHIEVGRFKR